ncbi:ATP-dependent DNA ligase [Solibacillus sp. NPDC093137]|uniref:ATP-dependent DNA ligase n=1 Tax=Solibacillus sp. NPDC093137 TaxID=3390678 RepID=UPI003D077B95
MFIEPMLLEKVDKPFNDSRYVGEWKMDGWRMLISKWDGKIRLYSRHKNEFTSVFKEFQNVAIPDNTILDCELIAVDEEGKCNFELLQNQYRAKHRTAPLQLVAFDILFYKGEDLRKKPLMERKQILADVIEPSDNLVITQYVDGTDAVQYFELIKQHGLEGIVMKLKDSFYDLRGRRSSAWLKVIAYNTEFLAVGGISKKKFGVYLSYLNGEYAGMIEFMSKEDRKKLYSLISKHKVREDENKITLDNKLIIEVKFRNKFKSGLLRLPLLSSWETDNK